MPDAGADFVDQILIVRDQEHGALVFLQRDVQSVDRFEVQVIRRLVQDQDVRLLSISRQKIRRAASPRRALP